MTPLQLLCKIIQTELGLANGQVYLWDQKVDIPTDERLYITVGILTAKPYSNRMRYDPVAGSPGSLNAVQCSNWNATVSVNIMSKSTQALDRKEEVLMALASTYSKQIQAANGIGIAVLPSSFVNLSEVDGAAIPYRFNFSVALQYEVTKTKAVDFYNTFTDSVITDP